MKKADLAKLKNRSAEELRKEVAESKEKLWELRREIAGGKIKNVKARSVLRRDIARMMTALSQANRPTGQAGLKGNKK
jgi:ribosomal protein L29